MKWLSPFTSSKIYWSPITLICPLTQHRATAQMSCGDWSGQRRLPDRAQRYLSKQCFPRCFSCNSAINQSINLPSWKIFDMPFSSGRKCKLNVICQMKLLSFIWESPIYLFSSLSLQFPPVTLPFSLTHFPTFFLIFFARLMWRRKNCPMESLSTYEASEKETGLERKHCKGKIVCNNTASSNLNLVVFHCFCLIHCPRPPF